MYGPAYSLDGFKWFSSATDSDVSLVLARTGPLSQGARSLSLFLVPVRLPLPRDQQSRPPSTSNGILTHRLKNKLGTQIVPTAELSLNDTSGYLIGDLHQGVKYVTAVLNITRVHSAVGSVGYVRRSLDIARSFASIRQIHTPNPTLLRDNALHMSELGKVAVTYRALTHFTFGVVCLMGKVECRTSDDGMEDRLRLLFPVIKGFCAEKGVEAVIECMVALGGQVGVCFIRSIFSSN
jgi:alkylation response protein AidB-like acyl-CoA dehydrogenase